MTPMIEEEARDKFYKFGNEVYFDWDGQPEKLWEFIKELLALARKEQKELDAKIAEGCNIVILDQKMSLKNCVQDTCECIANQIRK